MFNIEVNSINELLYEACNLVMMYGKDVEVRGMKTKELHPAHATVHEPLKRTLLYPYRGNNPFGTLFETVWVLGAKDNDITELAKFVPRAYDYSDDGKRWRAGYPERIRNYCCDPYAGICGVDQLQYVYQKLKADPESRQAVINLWNPLLDDFEDYGENYSAGSVLKFSKDFPCSQNLTFLIRDGKLDCTFYIRSNDAIYGCTAINLYEFTVMQELLAGMLGVGVGKFYYYINSLHIYEDKMETAKKIVTDGKPYEMFLESDVVDAVTEYDIPVFKWFDGETDYNCQMEMFEVLYEYLTATYDVTEEPISEVYDDIKILCSIYLDYKDKEFSVDTWNNYMKEMRDVRLSDLKVACHFWMAKNFKCIDKGNIHVAIEQMIQMEN